MSVLSTEQRHRALEVMQEYLAARVEPDGRLLAELDVELDQNRGTVIEDKLTPLLSGFLSEDVPLPDFKSEVDSVNKRHEHWGFKGVKGQMFFNMLVNVADDVSECGEEIKAALTLPTNDDMARSRIKTFVSYVRRIGEQHIEAGGTKHGRPKFRSVPFFLSYFWQVHDRHMWPVYYTNSVNIMIDLNLWQPTDDLAASYVQFKRIHEELAELYSHDSGKPFGLYDVEHVFWMKGGNPFGGTKPARKKTPPVTIKPVDGVSRLPDGYVPPIVGILPRMACNEPSLADSAKASGTSLDRAFEKGIHAAFTILGYDTTLLGQGQGRVPDGLAIDIDSGYAMLWDAKVRTDGYSMGTDDRTIREYITTQSRDLKRKRSLRNIYYLIISSGFHDDYDDTIRTLKMETDISEVCLFEAEALVAMVDAKLREPLQLSLGPDGLQRLCSGGGVLTSEMVRDTFA